MSKIQLIVQADDFGMCHAVNTGIVEAFEDGIVTQAALMAPCPWFEEAGALAREHTIPVGLHCTLTCEWDHLRWRPLTAGRSLAAEDGTMHRTLADALAKLDGEDAFVELAAQAAGVEAAGLGLICCDMHMGSVAPEAYGRLCEELGVPFLYPVVGRALRFESSVMLSHHDRDKKAWLLRHIDGLTPGLHYLCTHPATPGPELAAMARLDAENADWAERFRKSDLAVLIDPDIRAALDVRGVALVSAKDVVAA